MEILVPSLVFMLAAVAAAFFLLPRLAATVLVMSSAVVLVIAFYVHMQRFGVSEYERATWIYKMKDYSSYILIGVLLLASYGFYTINHSSSSSSNIISTNALSSSALPEMKMPTIGGGFDTISQTVSSRINELLRKGRISN